MLFTNLSKSTNKLDIDNINGIFDDDIIKIGEIKGIKVTTRVSGINDK
ncbi:MAG: hypothetical protein M3Z01_01665 [Thermoproteota archaeon]|nr:hypothetical protein [Thermoproteota archaeon]